MRVPDLSIVIPFYNEEARIGRTLTESAGYLKRTRQPCEILLVDDGSSDRTFEIVKAHQRRFPRSCPLRILRHGANRGKGAAVRTGAMAARGRFVLYMDADNSTPLSEYDKLKPAFEQGADVVIGSRAVDRAQIKVHQPIHRELMGRVFNLMVQALTAPGLWDTQCGFKVFTQRAARIIFPLQTIERFGFDAELLFIAKKNGFSIKEIQVSWSNSPDSRVDVLRDSTRMFFDLLAIRWNDLRGRYPENRGMEVRPPDGRTR